MQVIAKLRNLRIAPRKVRLVVDLIRGKKLVEAQAILNFAIKKAALPLAKLLKQAEANAKNNFQLDPLNLFISKITVDEGRKLKRWRPRARGQAYEIQRKTSHITLVLDEIKKTKIKKKAALIKKEVVPEEKKVEAKKTGTKKPQIKPELEIKTPKREGGIKRIFRRQVFGK